MKIDGRCCLIDIYINVDVYVYESKIGDSARKYSR